MVALQPISHKERAWMSLAVPQKGIVAKQQAQARGMSRQQIRTLTNNGT
jgi:hypothetical protein